MCTFPSSQPFRPTATAARRPRVGRRLATAVATYAFVVTMLATTVPTPLYELYRHRFGFSELMVTVIFATYGAGVIATLLLFGSLSDPIGRRPVLGAGLALGAAGMTTFLFADGVALLLGPGFCRVCRPDFSPAPRPRRSSISHHRTVGVARRCCRRSPRWVASAWGRCWRAWLRLWSLPRCRRRSGSCSSCWHFAALGVWAMPEPGHPDGRPTLRPQPLRVPAQARPAFVRGGLAAFAGFAVLGLFARSLARADRRRAAGSKPGALGVVVAAVFSLQPSANCSRTRFWARRTAHGFLTLIAGMGSLRSASRPPRSRCSSSAA